MAKELSEFEAALMATIGKEFDRRFCSQPYSDIRSGRFYPDPSSKTHFKFRVYHNAYYITINLRFDGDYIFGTLKVSDVKNDATQSLCGTAAIYDGYIDLNDPAMDVSGIVDMMMPTISGFMAHADKHAKFLKERLPFMAEPCELRGDE